MESELADRVKAFQDATSPASEYDPDAIAEAADNLQRTVADARGVLRSGGEKVHMNNTLEQQYLAGLGATLSGLSEQVAARLNDLAAGKVAERATIDRQAKQLLERAKGDELGTELKTHEASLAKKQEALQKGAKIRATNIAKEKATIQALNKLPQPLTQADTGKLAESEQQLARMQAKTTGRQDTYPKKIAADLDAAQTRRRNYDQALVDARGVLRSGRRCT